LFGAVTGRVAGSHSRDRSFGMVEEDGYLGSVPRTQHLSENSGRERQSGWVKKGTFDWSIMINMNDSAVLGASREWIEFESESCS
jgi:hypothetical protein